MRKRVALLTWVAAVAFSEPIVWESEGNGDWNVAGNWNPAQVPTRDGDVVIDKDVQVTVPNEYDANARNLTLSHGVNRGLYISNTGSLTVHGDYEQTAGLMQIRISSALMTVKGDFLATAGASRLIQGGSDGLIVEGNLTATPDYTFSFNMNNSPAGIKRVVVGGTMTPGGASLSLSNFLHNDTEEILLFHNTSDQEVQGSFGVPWGTSYVVDGERTYQLMLIDYDGDGLKNDVALIDMKTGIVPPSTLYEAWTTQHPDAAFSDYVFRAIPSFGSVLTLVSSSPGDPAAPHYMFARRKDAQARGLSYLLRHTTNLTHGAWDSSSVEELFVDRLDHAFETVAARIVGGDSNTRFARLHVTLSDHPPRGEFLWGGEFDGSWDEPLNWSGGQIPGSSDLVRIASGAVVSVPNGTHARAGVLHVRDGSLQVNHDGEMTVYGNVTVEDGGMVNIRTGLSRMTVKGNLLAAGGIGRVIQGQRDALIIEGDVIAGGDYRFDFNMNSTSQGIGRIVVHGTMKLGGTKLSLSNFVHNDMDKILLFHNTSDREVIGSFDIPWGTTFDLGAEEPYELRLIDWDGDGVANDVVLKRMEPVEPGVITWVYPGSGDWHVAGNWDLDRVPIAGDEVLLNPGTGVTVSVFQDASAGSILLESGNLVIQTVGNLEVSGDFEQTGGLVNTRTGFGKVIVGGNFVATAGSSRVIQSDKDAFIIEGDLTAMPEYTFSFNMNSSPDGVGRMVVGGTVTLGGANLGLSNFIHNDLDAIVLFHNTSDQEEIGSFEIPWGTLFDIEGELYELARIAVDDDGIVNDVALVRVSVPPEVDPLPYGLYGHGHIARNPTVDELRNLGHYTLIQAGLPTPAMRDYVQSVNPDFITAPYVLFYGPMWSHGQTAGFLERTDPDSIARSRAGVLDEPVDIGETSFKVSPSWAGFNFVASTLGEGIYYNADETDQETNSVSDFVTWVRVGDEVMKITGWDEELRILTVVRGIWGTEQVAHPAGAGVFSPMYGHQAYPNSPYGVSNLQYVFNPVDSGLPVQWFLDGGVPQMRNSLSASVANGNDGLWMDVSEPGWWFITSVDGTGNGSRMWNFADGESYNNESFALARNRQFHAIQTEWFARTGSWPYLIGNSINKKWYWPGDGNQRTYLMSTGDKPRPLDAMSNECFIGGIDEGVVTFHDPDFWRDNIRMLMDAAQSGLHLYPFIVNAGTKGRTVSDMEPGERMQLELYGFASYLLGWEPDHPGMALGVDFLHREGTGRKKIWVNPLFRIDIGVPVLTHSPADLDEYRVPGHSTYRRPYSMGVVLVNPFPQEDPDVPLGGVYLDPDTGAGMTSVSMPPNSGRIFLSD